MHRVKMPVFQDRAVVERLIRLVRDHPVLYDASIQEHRDAETINIVWSNISDAMGVRYVDADAWKKKWRNLRDTYVKQKKEERMAKIRNTGVRKKPWRFTHVMKFLDKVLELKSTENNMMAFPSYDDEEDAGTPDMSEDESASYTERSSVVSGGSQRTGNGQGDVSPSSPLAAVEDQAPFLPAARKAPAKRARYSNGLVADGGDITGLIRRKRCGQLRFIPAEDTDGDEAFFESCAHRMKKLPAQTRSFLKLQITQLFVNAENPDIAPLPITPLPVRQPKTENPDTPPRPSSHLSVRKLSENRDDSDNQDGGREPSENQDEDCSSVP